jgi:hypothetical protein
MKPDLQSNGPAVEHLIKELSFSTCSHDFFGELEKEMLVPNNVNVYGRITSATSLRSYKIRAEFPENAVIGYSKHPLDSRTEGDKRILIYSLKELINFDEYYWYPIRNETVFSLTLNLLPPFPELRTVGLQIACRPDTAVGPESSVKTTIGIEAMQDVDYVSLKVSTPMRSTPGISTAITEHSGDQIHEPRQVVTTPGNDFPFPRLGLKTGQNLEYTVTTKISADPRNISFLRCEQDILSTRLLALCESTPYGLPCGISVLDENDKAIPILRTTRSDVYQATAQILYSPFSSLSPPHREPVLQVATA